jgi:hypothetical protein
MNTLIGRIAFATYILVVTAIFILTWDKILGLLIFLTIAVQAAGSYALRHPESRMAWILFRHKHGPNTRIRSMTKNDLYRSGLHFLNLAMYPFLTLVALRALPGELQGRISTEIFTVIYFASSVFFLICVGWGVYFLMRGLLRRADYTPEPLPEDDVEVTSKERQTADMP